MGYDSVGKPGIGAKGKGAAVSGRDGGAFCNGAAESSRRREENSDRRVMIKIGRCGPLRPSKSVHLALESYLTSWIVMRVHGQSEPCFEGSET